MEGMVMSKMKTPVKTKRTKEAYPELVASKESNLNAGAVQTLKSDRATHLREIESLRSTLMEPPEPQLEEADPLLPEQNKNAALIEQIESHVADIERALQAAQEGRYGICEQCGGAIGAERLRILPETRLCVRCKRRSEQLTHHHSHHKV
jgi:RNA polymerase-binding transcription factor DksA